MDTYEQGLLEAIDAACAISLPRKVERAIALLREYEARALATHPEGYYVCYSGGKDSGCIKRLCELAGVRHTLNYNVTTLDPPELMRFVRAQGDAVRWHRQEVPLLQQMVLEGTPPSFRVRWCCRLYKERVNAESVKVIGVRALESANRAKRWTSEFTINKHQRQGAVLPILFWTDDDVWTFHRMEKIPYCSLYDTGLTRLGCVGCPMINGEKNRAEFERYPGHRRMWIYFFQKLLDEKGVLINAKRVMRGKVPIRDGEHYLEIWLTHFCAGAQKQEAPCLMETLFV